MLTFSDYIELTEEFQHLEEKLITFGGQAYPKFGQVVIMAGGAGSGKGFVKDKLVGVEGYNFDVDELKLLATRTPGIIKKVKEKMGIDITTLDPKKVKGALKDDGNVRLLHQIVGDELELDDRRKSKLFASALSADASRKPNLIFDVTMKNMKQLAKYTLPMQDIGYDKKNIHIVWVVNDIEVAIDQNAARERVVPPKILLQTHEGTSETMNQILNMAGELRRYMDGDIVLAFNKVGVDSSIVKGVAYGPNPEIDGKAMGPTKSGRKIGMSGSTKGGMYVRDANYVYVKRAGKNVDKEKLSKDLKAKIGSYVPDNVDWANFQ